MERTHGAPPSDRDRRDALEELQVRLRETRAELERARHGETPPEVEALRLEVKAAAQRNDEVRARGEELRHAVEAAGREVDALREALEDAAIRARGQTRRTEAIEARRARREDETLTAAERQREQDAFFDSIPRWFQVVWLLVWIGLTGAAFLMLLRMLVP